MMQICVISAAIVVVVVVVVVSISNKACDS